MKHDQVLHKRVGCVYRSVFSSPHVADRGGCLRWALDARRPWHDSGARHVPGPWEWAATGTHPWLLSQWLLLNIVGSFNSKRYSCGYLVDKWLRMKKDDLDPAFPCYGQSLRGSEFLLRTIHRMDLTKKSWRVDFFWCRVQNGRPYDT